jgi:xanthine dehydrogenase accessory factor
VDWLSAVRQLRDDGRPGVLVTVVEVRGHAPRDAGAKMVVGADHVWGSVGGGNLEEAAITRARELIAAGTTAPEWQESALSEHAANPHGKQCCGGVVRLLLEPLPARPAVAVFGLGHVGHELARILSRLEIQLHLVDTRTDQLDPLRLADVTDGVADVVVHQAVAPEVVLDRLPRGAHVLVMTHDHAEDLTLCEAALRNPDLGSIGLIGSAAKWSRFRVQLAAEGHDPADIARITCPIGLPDITGKEPAVIAVGVAADLVRTIQRQQVTAAGR